MEVLQTCFFHKWINLPITNKISLKCNNMLMNALYSDYLEGHRPSLTKHIKVQCQGTTNGTSDNNGYIRREPDKLQGHYAPSNLVNISKVNILIWLVTLKIYNCFWIYHCYIKREGNILITSPSLNMKTIRIQKNRTTLRAIWKTIL